MSNPNQFQQDIKEILSSTIIPLTDLKHKVDDLAFQTKKQEQELKKIEENLVGSMSGDPGLFSRLNTIEKDLERLAELQGQQLQIIKETISLNKSETDRLVTDFSIKQTQQLDIELESLKKTISYECEKKELEKMQDTNKWFRRTLIGAILTLFLGGIGVATKTFLEETVRAQIIKNSASQEQNK